MIGNLVLKVFILTVALFFAACSSQSHSGSAAPVSIPLGGTAVSDAKLFLEYYRFEALMRQGEGVQARNSDPLVTRQEDIIILRHACGVNEWKRFSENGSAHGFEVTLRPSSQVPGPVVLRGSIRIEESRPEAAKFISAESYSGLKAVDADGKSLASYLVMVKLENGAELDIVVDDSDAVYPIQIDPFPTY